MQQNCGEKTPKTFLPIHSRKKQLHLWFDYSHLLVSCQEWKYFEVTDKSMHISSALSPIFHRHRVSADLLFHHTKQRWCLYNDILFFPHPIVVVSLRISSQLGLTWVWNCVSAWRTEKRTTTKVVQGMDNDRWTRRRCNMWGAVCVCACETVCSPPTLQSHTVSTSAARRRWCNNNITHLISSAYFASPAAATPSLHIYHIHLIFRNKCSRKRIMHLLYAAFITDTFTWGFAFMVSNGPPYTGVPHICRERVGGCSSLHISAISERW